ncbi:MAG: SdpI family protein [Armatimonadetes bacterium]|nr:SdpI family protein [Armatimonadota bacterium]
MKTSHAALVCLALTAAVLAYGLVLYPALPEKVPTHWDIHGRVDGWGHKSWALFLMPGTMALFTALLYILPWLSPRGFKVEDFREAFNLVMVLVIALFGCIGAVMVYAASHPSADVSRGIMAGPFLFFAALGPLLPRLRKNFWMGIRTPWTLASDTIWKATHRFAGKTFLATGLLGAVACALGTPPAWCLVVLLIGALLPVPYSLVLYKVLESRGEV